MPGIGEVAGPSPTPAGEQPRACPTNPVCGVISRSEDPVHLVDHFIYSFRQKIDMNRRTIGSWSELLSGGKHGRH